MRKTIENEKKKNVKKTLIAVASMVTMINVLTGCHKNEEKQIKSLEENISEQFNAVAGSEDKSLVKFDVLAVEVEKNGFDFDVVFNGVATNEENEEKFYATVDYNVSSKYFSDLNSNSSKEIMFKTFNKIVNEHEIENYSLTPISKFSKINDAVIKNTPAPFEGYSVRSGLVYNMSTPNYNDETKEISFDAKMLTKLTKFSSGLGAGVGFSSGSVGVGVGIGFTVNKSLINIIDNYKINAKNLNYEEFKANPAKVFDYLVECIDKNDAKTIEANRLHVNAPEYQYANVFGHEPSKKLKNHNSEKTSFEF